VLIEGIPLWEKAQTRFVDQLGQKNWSGMLGGLEAAVNAAKQA